MFATDTRPLVHLKAFRRDRYRLAVNGLNDVADLKIKKPLRAALRYNPNSVSAWGFA